MKTKKSPLTPGTTPADQAIANVLRVLSSFNR